MKLGENLWAEEGEYRWTIIGENTYTVQKSTVETVKSILEFFYRKYFNRIPKISKELAEYRNRTGLSVDGKLAQGIKLSYILTSEGRWVLENPTIEDALRVQYNTREYSRKKELNRKKREEAITKSEKQITQQKTMEPAISGTKKVYGMEESRYRLYLKHLENSDDETVKLLLEDMKEILV